ncbi:MAG: hypothetical protein WC025_00760 [Candidatus Magasanikbacteria bacterium]
MRKTYLLLTSAIALMLIGAGCSSTTTPNNTSTTETPQVKLAEPIVTKTNTTTTDTTLENTTSEFILSEQPITKKGTVNLNWSASQELKDKVEIWRLVYGKDANPTEPATWYFERGRSHFGKIWSGLPSGKAHIRVCAVINDKCDVYSNDLEVDIK